MTNRITTMDGIMAIGEKLHQTGEKMQTLNFFGSAKMSGNLPPDHARRLMIFVDHSYVYKNAKYNNIRINHLQLADFLTNNTIERYNLQRVTVYGSIDRSMPIEKVMRQEKVYHMFSRFPKFDLQIYDLKVTYGINGQFIEKKEKCVDCALVTGLVKYALKGAYDTAIIVAGDEDFVPAVKEVIENGLEVVVAAFDGACSEKLVNQAMGYISLTDNLDSFVDKRIQNNHVANPSVEKGATVGASDGSSNCYSRWQFPEYGNADAVS